MVVSANHAEASMAEVSVFAVSVEDYDRLLARVRVRVPLPSPAALLFQRWEHVLTGGDVLKQSVTVYSRRGDRDLRLTGAWPAQVRRGSGSLEVSFACDAVEDRARWPAVAGSGP
jgi:hypothetical protein